MAEPIAHPIRPGSLPRDPTLRSVEVTDRPLRLNTEPMPADAMPLATGDHAARVAAALAWLEGLCGDYAPLRRQFVAAYFGFIDGGDRRRSERSWPNGCAHTKVYTRRRTFCGRHCVRCRAAG